MELFKKAPQTPQDLKPLGIYVHVPFCRSKCEYCDFYSLGGGLNQESMDLYLQAVLTHIKEAAQRAVGYSVDTVYFGGGTPSFFGADGMAAILTAIRKAFRVSSTAEITFEANPDSVSDRLLRRLRSEGFNRVSLGIQCDDDEMLKKLGRPHTYAQAVAAVQRIQDGIAHFLAHAFPQCGEPLELQGMEGFGANVHWVKGFIFHLCDFFNMGADGNAHLL